MDKVSMQLALVSAKASGDQETVRMIMSAMRGGEAQGGAQVASGLAKRVDGESRRTMVSGLGPSDEESSEVAGMLQKLLGELLGPQSQEAGEEDEDEDGVSIDELASRLGATVGSRMVVINGSTGEVVDPDDLPPEVLAAIKSMDLSQRGDDDGDEDENEEFDFSRAQGLAPTKH